MNVRNCRKCKRIFNYTVGPVICQQCKAAMEDEFQKVKKYVYENPGSDIRMVSEACEVDPGQIRQWVREERLCFSDDSPVGIGCERCGTQIKSGRFCEKCKVEMTTELKSAMPNKGVAVAAPVHKSSTSNKMRFLDFK